MSSVDENYYRLLYYYTKYFMRVSVVIVAYFMFIYLYN